MRPKLSICIPTYSRAQHLVNSLEAIRVASQGCESEVEICISDNASQDSTNEIINNFNSSLQFIRNRNEINIGLPRNLLKVVEIASGEFIWLVGDDDLVMPNGIKKILEVLAKNPDIDFMYGNAFHLDTSYVSRFPLPFDMKNLPKKMEKFSNIDRSYKCNFLELIDTNVSFDLLSGMFLSIFKKEIWNQGLVAIDLNKLADRRIFSNFDNTITHIKVFANSFSKSKAYFNSEPVIVCLTGAREWAPLYGLVRSVRFLEALEEYRRNGLSFFKYLKCRNNLLKYFIPDFVRMILDFRNSGIKYVNIDFNFVLNFLFYGLYISPFIYIKEKFSMERKYE